MKIRLLRALFPILLLALPLMAQSAVADIEAATIVHSSCATDCPVYTLRLEKSGAVRYEGKGFVKVYGPKTWTIPEQWAESTLERLNRFAAAGRPGKYLTDAGDCKTAAANSMTVILEVNQREEMPIPACYSEEVSEAILHVLDATGVSIYTVGRDVEAESAIRAVLDAQVEAWNKADIEGFMRGYWMSSELTFFSGATETKGWKETLERYRKSYKTGGKEMGQLTFDGLRIEMLSPDAAFVRGAWKLTMPDGKTPHGLFTLIFRKMPDGWRIIHDSTGAA